MSCAPKNVWQYCWRERFSAVAYNLFSALSVKARDFTLHVLCRDKYRPTTSMQQYHRPGNSYNKNHTLFFFFFTVYMQTREDRPNQMFNNVLLFSFFFFLNPVDLPRCFSRACTVNSSSWSTKAGPQKCHRPSMSPKKSCFS